ncbi:MAG TPA: HEPN domain-containing protein [Candidatus Altiarchaeales archaeon]|nr:HEPN domain-containing protein [Candidatus Altiarchaeales archaeon]
MKKEIKDLLEKADRYLRSAELLLKDGDFDSCTSRCY